MKFNIYLIARKRKHPPLGIGYLKTYAEKNIKEVNINIIEVENYEETLDYKLYRTNPDLIGFSCYENPEIFIETSKKIKNKFKKTLTLLGGPAITTSFYDRLDYKKSVDYIIIGEGEETFSELLSYLIKKYPEIDKIKGVMYLKENHYKLNPLREPIKDINKIPSPYLLGVFDLKKYEEFYIENSRGCLYNCNYCAVTNSFLKYRKFDEKRVIKELDFIIKNNPDAKSIEFCDSDIFHDTERATKILTHIKNKKMKTMFNFNTEATKLNDELIKLISMPNITIAFGLQTLTKKALIQTNRFFNIKEIEDKIIRYKDTLHNMTQPFVLSCIYGLPGDNFKNFEKTVEFGLKTQARLDFFKLMIWKNTGFYKMKENKIKFSHKYPYWIKSTSTYTEDDIYKTEKQLNEIYSIIKLSEKDRYISEILNKTSLLFKTEKPHIYTYTLFSSFIKADTKRKNLISKLINVNRFDYMNGYYSKRLKLYNMAVKFIYEIIKNHKKMLISDYYKKVFEISEFIKNIEMRLYLKKEINIYNERIKQIIDTDKFLTVKWMDFNIKYSNMINISDKLTDKTEFDPEIHTVSIDEITDIKFKENKILFFYIYSWIKNKEKLIKKIKGDIYIFDWLNSDEFNFLKKRFDDIKSFKLGRFNLYICRK